MGDPKHKPSFIDRQMARASQLLDWPWWHSRWVTAASKPISWYQCTYYITYLAGDDFGCDRVDVVGVSARDDSASFCRGLLSVVFFFCSATLTFFSFWDFVPRFAWLVVVFLVVCDEDGRDDVAKAAAAIKIGNSGILGVFREATDWLLRGALPCPATNPMYR